MPHEVIMPALGMAQDTGLIVRWLKAPGDAVKTGDALFEVETDKATMEVEAPSDGFLTDIRAEAGADVPVGDVIALISDTAEGSGGPVVVESDPASGFDVLPEGAGVIMPALGMAQDTGLIVAWHKAPGDPVAVGDVLFEVETDKSTMEVEADHDGFVAALLAQAGEEAPVGEVIAIVTVERPAAPIQRSLANALSSARPPAPIPKKPAPASKSEPKSVPKPAAMPPLHGRILASPKLRRLAFEQGLDLNRLVAAGHPQPYHVADLTVLKSLSAATLSAATLSETSTAAPRRLVADLPVDGFSGFATWAAEHAGLRDGNALLAGLAAASLVRDGATVAVECHGEISTYAVPAGPLGGIAPADPETTPDLRLCDLRHSRISAVTMGADDVPVLTLTRAGAGLSITLECAAHQLSASQAVTLLSNFAGRMEQPLRHLL
jgi:pyruvate/2-oxoglutarate dehydrogenase complex dihydrolipoamide acyltransferase (E2) component